MNTVTCCFCGNEVLDRDSVDADYLTHNGGSACYPCVMDRGEEW